MKKNYDLIIIDKYNINFELLNIKYGLKTNNIDITDIIKILFFNNNKLYIKNCVLNDLAGDPMSERFKKIVYKL